MNEREAAARLRLLYEGKRSYYETYGCEQTLGGHQQRDERKLIDAYLALVPADSEEPITEEWLRSMGFKDDDERPYVWINAGWQKEPGFDLERWNDGDWTISAADNTLKLVPPKTRSDVRGLCKHLGITLKSPTKGSE